MSTLRQFVDDYRLVRAEEGFGIPDPEYARQLPYRDITGRNAASWRARAFHYLIIRLALQTVRADTPGAPRVLDLGAGNGWMARRLGRSFRVTALDVDGGDAGLGSLRDHRVARVVSDIEALPLRAGSFDAVIAAATLHYALDLFGALAEAARVLRRGGLLIIADSPVYADAVARDQAWQRTLAHYTAFGAPHLAARYHGLTRAELDGTRLFRFVTASPGFTSARAALRGWRHHGLRLPVLLGWKR